MIWQWKLQHLSSWRTQWKWQTRWRQRPRNWKGMIKWWRRSRWQKSQRRGQWRLHKNRQFCIDWWWDWTNAETTTRVSESGVNEYADIWCTILYNECGGGRLVMGKKYPQTKWKYQQIVISRLKVIHHKHWHAVNWKERWPWKVVCVNFEGCKIWGGSLPVVEIASKVASIDQDIAPSEGVSGEHIILPLCQTEILDSNDIFVHIAQCNHSLVWN